MSEHSVFLKVSCSQDKIINQSLIYWGYYQSITSWKKDSTQHWPTQFHLREWESGRLRGTESQTETESQEIQSRGKLQDNYRTIERWSPTTLAPETCSMEDKFSSELGWEEKGGFRMIQAHYMYCALLHSDI